MSTNPVYRTTLFKIPNPEDQQTLLNQYSELSRTAVKHSAPYILSLHAGPCIPDPRSQYYNFSVNAVFASLEDMQYYDNDCEAHKKLKDVVGPIKEGMPLTVYFEGGIVSGTQEKSENLVGKS
ncbi:hypothetical protein MMC06_000610 [Schaereria dolodes]|nr:hypothetical protein [Schaereria dolodes]